MKRDFHPTHLCDYVPNDPNLTTPIEMLVAASGITFGYCLPPEWIANEAKRLSETHDLSEDDALELLTNYRVIATRSPPPQ